MERRATRDLRTAIRLINATRALTITEAQRRAIDRKIADFNSELAATQARSLPILSTLWPNCVRCCARSGLFNTLRLAATPPTGGARQDFMVFL